MYTITTFTAQHNHTVYTKPPGGGPDLPMGYENTAQLADYERCIAQLEAFSQPMITDLAERIKKVNPGKSDEELKIMKGNGTLVKPEAVTWVMHRMWRDAKQPQLLHYIDNNYPGIAMTSKA